MRGKGFGVSPATPKKFLVKQFIGDQDPALINCSLGHSKEENTLSTDKHTVLDLGSS